MRRRALLLSLVMVLVIPIHARALPPASPEEVGLSRERLARIGQALNGQIELKSFHHGPPDYRATQGQYHRSVRGTVESGMPGTGCL